MKVLCYDETFNKFLPTCLWKSSFMIITLYEFAYLYASRLHANLYEFAAAMSTQFLEIVKSGKKLV